MSDLILTVITPVYNSVDFIEKCILNVIDQNCTDEIEHLIIDAESNDGTLEIIKNYAQRYTHIKFISEKDKGQSEAMNKGIRLAKGEYISFLNADDGYYKYVLKRVISIFKSNNKLAFITGNCKLFNNDGELIYINRPQRMRPYHQFSYLEPFPINPSAYFYSKKIHNEVGFYNEENHFTMDYEFILLSCLKEKIIYFNEDWGYAIYHEGSKSLNDTKNNLLFQRKIHTFNTIYRTIPFKWKILSKLYKIYKSINFLK